jgi:hypothetical protein
MSEVAMEVDKDPIEFLMKPENYPEKPLLITHVETHISHVFLGDKVVYKIKKPVNFGFLDFTTLEKRYFYCNEEVTLNKRLARDIYLGVLPLYRKEDRYSFAGSSGAVIVEYAVKMKRIPEEKLLSHFIGQGALLYGAVGQTGEVLAHFHREAPVHRRGPYGGIEAVRTNCEENFDQIEPHLDVTIDRQFYDQLVSSTRDFLDGHENLFRKRKGDGFVREVHGDLHSQHVCLTHPPIIFDCIEFNKRFRIGDVLEDIAFLLMDLDYRGRFDLSAAISNAYFSHIPEAADADLLQFYKTYRAVVRGKIEGFTADALQDDQAARKAAIRRAREYFGLARYYLGQWGSPFNPVVVMGVSGSGKSVIARDLFAGSVVLKSDELRKTLAGVPPEEHVYVEYGTDIYGPDLTKRTYRMMLEEAVVQSSKGKRVIVDATFLSADLRLEFYGRCIAEGLSPFFVYCFAREAILRRRIKRRMAEAHDVSDAHPAVLERQLRVAEEPDELPFFRVMRLNTGMDRPEAMKEALRLFL